MTAETERVPARADVPAADTWDLTTLFETDATWEASFGVWTTEMEGFAQYRGRLGESAAVLHNYLAFETEYERKGDRLGTFAFLKETEDLANPIYQGMKARYLGVAARANEASSFSRPEILALAPETLAAFLADPALAEYKLLLERVGRYRPHTLSEKEERLLALQLESSQTAHEVFGQLTNADMKFGTLAFEGRTLELSHATYASCLENPDRALRRAAFHQYYAEYADHANTLATTYAGSVKQDIYNARVRNYPGARAAALFPDQVPPGVYDQLIAAVRANLPAVHKYYGVRRRAMNLPELHFYDTYVPILTEFRKVTPWPEAVELVLASLEPLGAEYTETLARGLRGRWCDRYENKGKRSGAFSSGCYDSDPFILMNYKPDVLDDVFTLTHEAGHSMHTHYSKAQPYQYANYTIFVAEVASTFNEQLLTRTLMARATSDRERAYYLNKEIDSMRATIVRQTMFAEFEKIAHERSEANEPLTLAALRAIYRELLEVYLGPGVTLDDEQSLEGLRIPHFYGAFYVYKYATGLAAAIALSQKVLNGGPADLAAYLDFLRGGSSRDPLDLLRAAGVDLATAEPVDAALKHFAELVDELDGLLR